MTEKETARLFAEVAALYPREKAFVEADVETVKTWQRMLADIDFSLAEAALQRHAALSQWPPTIAEIRSSTVALTLPMLDSDQAYGLVRTAMRKYGYNRAKEAMQTLPQEVQDVVRQFGGFVSMCHCEEAEIQRAQFMKTWDMHKKRKQERALLPPAVLELLDAATKQLPEGYSHEG